MTEGSSRRRLVYDNEQVLRVGHNDKLLLPASDAQQLQFILQQSSISMLSEQLLPLRHSTRVDQLTSASSPSTSPPAALTNPHTIPASSSAPCVSLSAPDAEVVAAALGSSGCVCCCCCCCVCDLAVRSSEICPAVLRTAPELRSSAMVALTPGFFESRASVSSRASGPFVWSG